MEFSLSQMYGEVFGLNLLASVKCASYELYADYVAMYESRNVTKSLSQSSQSIESTQSDRKSTRLNSSHSGESRMPSSA